MCSLRAHNAPDELNLVDADKAVSQRFRRGNTAVAVSWWPVTEVESVTSLAKKFGISCQIVDNYAG